MLFFFLAVVLVVPEFLRDLWRFFYTYKNSGLLLTKIMSAVPKNNEEI